MYIILVYVCDGAIYLSSIELIQYFIILALLSYDNNTNEVLSQILVTIQVLTHKPRTGDVRIK